MGFWAMLGMIVGIAALSGGLGALVGYSKGYNQAWAEALKFYGPPK